MPELEKITMGTFSSAGITGGSVGLDGELYSTKLTFQEIVASVRRTKNISENKLIKYHVYDIANNAPYANRREYLYDLYWRLTDNRIRERIAVVDTCNVKNWDDIEHFMERFLSLGYEGLMYRHPDATYQFGKRSKYLLKYKKMKTEDVMCVGYKEGKGKHEGMLGALECTCDNGSIVWVGTGFNDLERCAYWGRRHSIVSKILTIKYQEKTDGGVSRFPVFVCWRDYE